MTEEERNTKIVSKLDRLVAARKEYGMMSGDLRELGPQMEVIGRVLGFSPGSVKISADGKFLTAPADKDGHKENLSIEEMHALASNITRRLTLTQEIDRIERYLQEAGYGDFIKK